ncbi:hypothetical protein [Streptomyces lydicus]|uniref:hypothetical protein n=1 Tax=Streptomyces lydicus TaxID=47763 RepID=UPI0037941634
MDRPGDAEFDPDAVLWVRGVDYMAGWRDATRAAAELSDALTAADVDETAVKLRAGTTTDGSGLVRLELSPATAREVAKLVRVAAGQWRKAG